LRLRAPAHALDMLAVAGSRGLAPVKLALVPAVEVRVVVG
jgi:hypothetical protein